MQIRYRKAAAAALICFAIYQAKAQKANLPEMAVTPAGEFEMGSNRGASWERPVHRVRTPKFAIGVRPVSNAEFAAFKPGHVSSGDTAPSAPVTGVSWHDAMAYCAWLSDRTGFKLQLPTEAWWERAARGWLRAAPYPWGDQPLEDRQETPPNGFGVYAVGYNLWEWMADWYSPNYFAISPIFDPRGPERGVYRVLRGGGYRNDPASATVYNRGSARPDTRSASITFRIARPLEGEAPTPTLSSAGPPTKKPPPPRPAPSSSPLPAAQAAAPPPKPKRPAPAPSRPKPKPAPVRPASQPSHSGGAAIRDVSFETSGGDIVVKLAIDGKAGYKTMTLSNPDRLVLDIPGGRLLTKKKVDEVAVGRGGVRRIRYSQFQLEPPAVRVVVDLDQPMSSDIDATSAALRIRLSARD